MQSRVLPSGVVLSKKSVRISASRKTEPDLVWSIGNPALWGRVSACVWLSTLLPDQIASLTACFINKGRNRHRHPRTHHRLRCLPLRQCGRYDSRLKAAVQLLNRTARPPRSGFEIRGALSESPSQNDRLSKNSCNVSWTRCRSFAGELPQNSSPKTKPLAARYSHAAQ